MEVHLRCDETSAAERASLTTVAERPVDAGEVRQQQASVGVAIFFLVLLAFALRWIIRRSRRANVTSRRPAAHAQRIAPPPIAVHTHRTEELAPLAHGARVELSPTAIEILEDAPKRAPAPVGSPSHRPPPVPRAEYKFPIAPTKLAPVKPVPGATTSPSPAARSSVLSDQQAAARTQSHAEWADAMREQIRRSARGA